MEKPILDPPVPYIGPVYGGRFSPGKIVRIQGIVPGVAYRFDINLQCGPSTSPRDDIAVQVAVRVLDGYISLNSLQSGIWGEEQRGVKFPIKRAERFEIIILCDFSQYKVAINGQHYCEFPQKIHYDRITHLAIDGDVSIIQISYESSSSASASHMLLTPIPRAQDETDTFEILEDNRMLPGVGFAKPPPYNAVVPSNQGAYSPYSASSPMMVTPYPMGSSPNAPSYPTGVPGIASAYPSPGAPVIPPPPAGAPVPLNACSSNFRRVKRSNTKKILSSFGTILLLAVLIILAVVLSKSKKSSKKHYSSSDYDHNNYNNYDYDKDQWQRE